MAQTDFGADELRARREKLIEAIGDQAITVLQGDEDSPGMGSFRQGNEFYYLCGIEVPHAYLLVNGKSRRSTLFLPHASQVNAEHDQAVPSADAPDLVKALAGVDDVRGTEALGSHVQHGKVAYTLLRPGQGFNMTSGSISSWYSGVLADPWDGRPHRAAQFIADLQRRCPGIEVRDLSPILDELRLIKSASEIALLRRAGQLTARAACEAMRSTRPGVMEFQLDAVLRYQYLAGGARGQAYHAIVAGGANAWHGHYKENNCELKAGDWVLCDCAPDYRYYTSDIGRMWPVDGTYSAVQRQLYGFVVAYHKVLLERIRPGRMMADIEAEAAEVMRGVLGRWTFSSPIYEAAARGMFEFRGHLSHCVGMCVHDGGGHWRKPLEPGIVFSVDPQMRVPEERLYIRVEDTVVVTADGIENLTRDTPLELDDVEAAMREPGLLQAFPPACP